MFGTIKDAFEKYVLMDHRITELEERIKKLETAFSNISKVPSKFDCKACGAGKYRAVIGKCRLFEGDEIGTLWKCDHCGHQPGELHAQELDRG